MYFIDPEAILTTLLILIVGLIFLSIGLGCSLFVIREMILKQQLFRIDLLLLVVPIGLLIGYIIIIRFLPGIIIG